MSRPRKIFRRLLLGAGFMLALAGLALAVVHTGVVRRLALARIQRMLAGSQGLLLDAGELKYNLLSSWFEIDNVVVRGSRTAAAPPPLKAQTITVRISVWRLLRGSFETAQVRIDRLSIQWIANRAGQTNWPALSASGERGTFRGPDILVTNGELDLQDEREDLRLHLPLGRLSTAWNAAKQEYEIASEGAGGELRWKGSLTALDRFRLKSALVDKGVVVESLHLASGESEVEVRGTALGSPVRIDAAADIRADLRHLGGLLKLPVPMRGRVQASVSATGLLEGLKLAAVLRGDDMVVRGIPIRQPAAESVMDLASGEVRIHSISAGLLSGRLNGSAKIWTGPTRGRSEFTARFDGLDMRQAAAAFGSSTFPAGRANLELRASWAGLDLRNTAISGRVRSGTASVGFNATSDPGAIHSSFEASLGGGDRMQCDVSFRPAGETVTGVVRGKIDSLSRTGRELETLLQRPAGSIAPAGVDGIVNWSATIGGTAAIPSASLQLEVNRLSVGEWNGAELRLEAGYAPDRIAINRALLAWGGQQIEIKGEVGGTSTGAPLQLNGTIQGQSLAGVFEKLHVAPMLEAAVSGDVRISGSIAQPAAEVTLRSGALTAFGERFASASLDAGWQGGGVTLKRLAVEQDGSSATPGHFEASGTLDVGLGRYAIDATGENLHPTVLALPGAIPLTGAFQLKAHGNGTLSDPVFNAEIAGTDVKAGDFAVGDLHAKVEAKEHCATAVVSAPSLNIQATSTIGMEGAWPFELTLDAQKTHLNTNPAATFDAAIRANGTLAEAHLNRATAGIQNLRLSAQGQEIVSDGPIELSYQDGRMKVSRLDLKSGASVLRLTGDLPLEDGGTPGSVSLHSSIDLASLPQWLPALGVQTSGGLEVNVAVTGSLQTWQPSGTAAIHDGSLHLSSIPLPFDNVSGRLQLENGAIRAEEITAKAGTGTLRFDGSLPLGLISQALPAPVANRGQPARFSAQVDKVELSQGSGKTTATTTLGLKIEGEASALSLSALKANVEFDHLAATTGNSTVRQASPTRIAVEGGVARLQNFELEGAGSSLKVSGAVDLTGTFPLQLEAVGQTDLAILSALAPPLEAGGAVKLDLKIGGTLSAPKTTGFVELERASFSLPVPRLQGGDIKMRAELADDQVRVKELTGTLNGGAFQGGGELSLGAEGLHNVNLFLTGKDTFIEYPVGLKTVSTLDLKFVSRGEGLALAGKVDVQEGYFESSIDLFRSEQALGTISEVAPGPKSRPVALDIELVTKRPVEMDNNLGRVAGTANLRLTGDVNQVRLVGTGQLEADGRLYFGERTYYVERGTVRFLDAPKVTPELNIRAYTRNGDYTIYLGLTGELNEVTTTFTSDPPLSRDDVIAVLLTGKTVAENHGVDLRALEATALATGALNASLSSQMHRAIGVSRVSIQPAAIAAESNPGARITVTQDFTRSLRLIYSMNLSDSNDQIWVGEYDLSRHLTTRAVKQTDNSYRGEFRHDIRFGSSPRPVARTAVPAAKQKISNVQVTGTGPFSPGDLQKVLKLKPGQKYQSMKVRKATERLAKHLAKKGYLESRVHMDRDADSQGVALTVRIDLGPTVQLAFQGAKLSGKQQKRVRSAWRVGISDTQRPQAAKSAILDYYAQEGYLRAEVESAAAVEGDRKVVRFDLKPGINYRDVRIVVEGAEPHRAREIMSLVHERPVKLSVYRDPARAIDAITRYYQLRGYLAAKVAPPVQTLDAASRTARIVIPIEEGPVFRVDRLQFSGNQALTADDLRSGLPLEPGAVFEPARLDPALAALKLKYGKLGYRETDIDCTITRHEDRASVDVSFAITEKQQTSIRAVSVEGNRRTSEKFARSKLRVAAGDVANTALIRESVKNLSQTGAYTSTDIQLRPTVESGAGDKPVQVADLVLAVSEPKPFRLLYGGLYDTGGGPGFIADLQNHNSLGAGRTLGLRVRVDPETDEARIYVTRPFWRNHRLSTTLATYFMRQTEYHQTSPTETLGVSIQQDLPLRSKWLLSYGYRFEKQRGFVPDPAAPNIPATEVLVAPLTFTLSRDARDSFLDATRGSFVSHGFEYAPRALGSDYPYFRYYLQYFKYFGLTRPRAVPYGEKEQRSRLVFATGSRVGLQKGFSQEGAVLTDRFYAGGGTTVRGFRQDELGPKLANGQPAGGNAVLVLNEELRYPLFWVFDAVTFVDIGNVYPRVSDFKFSELRSAGGFGLRIRNPFVVLRFDYGFKFHRRPGETIGAFFFSIGQAF